MLAYLLHSRSEATLQRQNSVRLLASMKGPSCGMEEDHMRKVFIEVCCKSFIKVSSVDVAFLQYSTVDSALQHFSCSGFLKYSSKKTLRMC